MTKAELIEFEREVIEAFRARRVPGPVHLSGGNEEELIELFRKIIPGHDWVLSTYRSHYHALLHGVPRAEVMAQIMAGRSMNLSFPKHRFLTSAIVGGLLPVAAGIAAGIRRSRRNGLVWCFVGDMAASIGAFADAQKYAEGHDLPLVLVVEDNGLSCDSPTVECWGPNLGDRPPQVGVTRYGYRRKHPHVGIGEWVAF